MTISVLGAGSWGSALAISMSYADSIKLWTRSPEQASNINSQRINSGYLPDSIKFTDNITATTDFDFALNTDLLIIATPCGAFREILTQIKQRCTNSIPDIIWVCKGFEVGSGLLPHQILEEICPGLKNYGALLGPSFAVEVARGLPTAITLASNNLDFALRMVKKFKPMPNFRIYSNTDVIGSEVGAGVKNIMAIAVGIADGLQLGYNARAALITRSLNELGQLVILLGGRSETIYGLTGIGDLILTCTGDLSRNRTVGLELAKGYPIDVVLASLGHVAEGVNAAKEVYDLSKRLKVDMPIVEGVYKIIYNQADLSTSVIELLKREPKLEFIPKQIQ